MDRFTRNPLVIGFALALCVAALWGPRRASGADAPAPVLQRDVVYQTLDGVDYKLDICVPEGRGPFPLVMWIHGGAWQVGDKSKMDNRCVELARHGYVAATINYRFAPKFRFPAQLEDAQAALRFLVKNAGVYQIDPNRIGTAGESAGAHLALLLGFDGGDPDHKMPKVRCVVNCFGPVDLTNWVVTPLMEFLLQKRFHKSFADGLRDFLGTKDLKSPAVAAASPLTFVTKDSPPVITFHGTLDPIVPFHQAELLHDALRKVGVSDVLVPVEGGLHGNWPMDQRQKTDRMTLEFLDKHLKAQTEPRAAK